MKLLFLGRNYAVLRNYERVIAELAARGHRVHLAAIKTETTLGGERLVRRLADASPNITFSMAPDREGDPEFPMRSHIRHALDYLRYLTPAYENAPRLRSRARERTPQGMVRFSESRFGRTRLGTWLAHATLRTLEAAFPRDPAIDAWLDAQAPDAVLFTPLLSLGSSELDFLEAADRAGLPTVFCVWSWDNLTSKALIRTMPSLVMVWNDVQREEARTLHAVPDDRIVVTGAQNFDHWFERSPSSSRAAFCTRVGLPDARPFVLWVCSALFRGGEPEAPFVRRWIEAIRASPDPVLREAAILVRPHPSRLKEWGSVSLEGLGAVAFYGANPIDPSSQADYFDSLYHAHVVVGLNTSAFLEAAIVGRPVHALLLPEFFEHQEGTLHFRYLLEVGGGLLEVSRTLEAHVAQLAEAMRAPETGAARSRRFVEAFLRPRGMEQPATGLFVEAIETRLARNRGATRRRGGAAIARPIYHWLVKHQYSGVVHRWLLSDRERATLEKRRRRDAEWRERKQERKALKKARARKAV